MRKGGGKSMIGVRVAGGVAKGVGAGMEDEGAEVGLRVGVDLVMIAGVAP